jgi:hypothetical protein
MYLLLLFIYLLFILLLWVILWVFLVGLAAVGVAARPLACTGSITVLKWDLRTPQLALLIIQYGGSSSANVLTAGHSLY